MKIRGFLRRELTLTRWRSNPFQLIATAMMGGWSVLQLFHGVTPDSVLDTQVDYQAQITLSATNLLGALICLVGLHMRDLASALWIEVIGYISLSGSLAIYVWLVADKSGAFNTAYGYALVIAFILGSGVRATQIFLYKRAERRRDELSRLVDLAIEDSLDDERIEDDGGR